MQRLRSCTAYLSIGVLALTLSTGCETMSEHKVASGAGIGALAGAAAGAAIGGHENRTAGVLIGAAAGAALGGGVGYYLDKKAQQYDEVDSVDVYKVENAEDSHLRLRLSNSVLFDKNSAALTAQGTTKVAEVAEIMRKDADSHTIVKAYASEEGSEEANLALSKRRADAVRNILIANRVAPSRITSLGMGESNPVASNDTETGRMQNRRVEIEVYPRDTIK